MNARQLTRKAQRTLAPVETNLCLAYQDGDKPVVVVYPAPRAVAQMMAGLYMDDTGRRHPPMTELEACNLIFEKSVPRHVNHRVLTTRDKIPADREHRNAWRLA